MLPTMLAEATPMDGIITAITTGATAAATGASSAISAVLPIAMPVIGMGLVITIGIKVFKRVTGKA